jgi:LuxR family maltose regulon positive regulatory protein
VTDLDEAVTAGVPAGYLQLFLDEGTELEPPLRRLAASDLPGAQHATRLLASGGQRLPGAAAASGSPALAASVGSDQLSDRELEVLRLLASDLTGPEIAQHLFVSVNTLRSHTKHIFTKLDVNTRRAAVRRATDLGLL